MPAFLYDWDDLIQNLVENGKNGIINLVENGILRQKHLVVNKNAPLVYYHPC